jgi:Au+-exporting ATPase
MTDLELAEGFELDLVLAKVAAVESRSEHPIARAIVEAALEKRYRCQR